MAGQLWQPGLSPCAARGYKGRGYTCTRIKERVLRCVALHVLACRWGFAQPSAARIVCSVGGMCCLASHFPGRAVLGARSTGLCAGQHKAISSAHFPVGAHCMLSSFRRWRQRPPRPARRPGGRGPRSPHASRGCKVGEAANGHRRWEGDFFHTAVQGWGQATGCRTHAVCTACRPVIAGPGAARLTGGL